MVYAVAIPLQAKVYHAIRVDDWFFPQARSNKLVSIQASLCEISNLHCLIEDKLCGLLLLMTSFLLEVLKINYEIELHNFIGTS